MGVRTMKTPEEIKKGLACCAKASLEECDHCPYRNDCDIFEACNLYRDALAYINQLEARVEAEGDKLKIWAKEERTHDH